VWALIDPGWYTLLVGGRGWTHERFRDWLVRALTAETLGGT
jgi:hypothetical protein